MDEGVVWGKLGVCGVVSKSEKQRWFGRVTWYVWKIQSVVRVDVLNQFQILVCNCFEVCFGLISENNLTGNNDPTKF